MLDTDGTNKVRVNSGGQTRKSWRTLPRLTNDMADVGLFDKLLNDNILAKRNA